MEYDSLKFHNIVELREVDGEDGLIFQRIPEEVRSEVNPGAQANYQRPAGAEIRFVPDGDTTITLSCVDGECDVFVFWGPFQGTRVAVGPEPTQIEIEEPDRTTHLRPDIAGGYRIHPRVCRLILPHQSTPVFYHGVRGEVRPPREDEVPSSRYIAYGTSITRGIAATAPHLTYVNETARRLGVDFLNLGTAGSAFCEPEIADYIAQRGDWDVALLALSVNMVAGFSVTEFERRVEYMVGTIAAENPDKPVIGITLFPYFPDLCTDTDGHENYEQFRDVLRTVTERTDHDNVHVIEGPDVLPDAGGLTTDLVHPGDHAMISMGEHLAEQLGETLAR